MAKTGNGRNGKPTSVKRRAEIRRTLPRKAVDFQAIFSRGDLMTALLVLALLVTAVGVFVNWSREQVKLRDGQVMTETRLKRLDYQVEDEAATQRNRDAAKLASPRIYRLNRDHINRLEAALQGLPRAVAEKTDLDDISQELMQEFQLTEEALQTLQRYVADGEPTSQWLRWVAELLDTQLRRRPLITSQEYQVFTTTANTALGQTQDPIRGQPIAIDQRPETRAETASRLREVVTAAGFPREVVPHIAWRLAFDMQPTILHDQALTEGAAAEAIAAVPTVLIEHKRGEVLYRRGDVLSGKQYEETLAEAAHFAAGAPWTDRWLPRVGLFGLAGLLLAFLALHIARTYPRIVQNPVRTVSVSALVLLMLAVSGLIAVHAPNLIVPAAIAPTLLVAIVVLLAYDLRLALLVSGLQAVLVSLALGYPVGWIILLFVACGTMVTQLRDVRHRNTLIRAATVTAIVLGAGSLLLGIVETPIVPGVSGAPAQMLWNALWAMSASFGVGFLVLGVLPSIEKLFDITTGMTLAELRDPKQQLLRQLQQRAPGTYNHSLQVANVAEAAADAIGADSLLVYVGALYHDIGKLNKPEYFVENQAGGVNKHDKLSPAMSLLIIIGHVKDGVELAREFNLPRSIIHFIESHHGTTLVEYFYRAAQTRAKQDERFAVAEVEFRYPGPKPRTKEAAIMMLADAVESATRAMSEPNPSRIESLVREISRKRLMDGQFNQCDLTFRELGLIEEAIIGRLCAIYHGRISYAAPTEEEEEASAAATPDAPARSPEDEVAAARAISA